MSEEKGMSQFDVILSLITGGSLLGLLRFFRDSRNKINERITEMLKVEREFCDREMQMRDRKIEDLERQIKEMQSTVRVSTLPVWERDGAGIFTDCNAALELKILAPMGLTRTDFIGRSATEVFGGNTAALLMASDRKARENQCFCSKGVALQIDLPLYDIINEAYISTTVKFKAILCPVAA